MTGTSLADRSTLEASEAAVSQAGELVSSLPEQPGMVLVDQATGRELTVPRELSGLLRRILRDVAAGRDVRIVASPEELTTSAAARSIGVSRPTLMKIIAAGDLPAHRVGTHTRIKSSDLGAFLRARNDERRAALESLIALSDELGEE